MIVLDTDHLSVLQRSNSTHASQLRERLIAVTNESVVATIISYEEQVRSWLSQIGRHSDVVEQVPFYDHLIRFVEFFSVWELLPFSEEAARKFKQLRKQRIRISSTDLKIAAVALIHKATLLSRNAGDFQQIPGLKVENWLPD